MRLFRSVISICDTMAVFIFLSKSDCSLQHKKRFCRGELAPCWEVLSEIVEYLSKFRNIYIFAK